MEQELGKLLEWLQKVLSIDLDNFQQLCNGSVWCQLLHLMQPHAIKLSSVNFKTENKNEIFVNYRLLIQGLEIAKMPYEVPVQLLIQGNFDEIFIFTKWMKWNYETSYDYNKRSYNAIKERQIAISAQQKKREKLEMAASADRILLLKTSSSEDEPTIKMLAQNVCLELDEISKHGQQRKKKYTKKRKLQQLSYEETTATETSSTATTAYDNGNEATDSRMPVDVEQNEDSLKYTKQLKMIEQSFLELETELQQQIEERKHENIRMLEQERRRAMQINIKHLETEQKRVCDKSRTLVGNLRKLAQELESQTNNMDDSGASEEEFQLEDLNKRSKFMEKRNIDVYKYFKPIVPNDMDDVDDSDFDTNTPLSDIIKPMLKNFSRYRREEVKKFFINVDKEFCSVQPTTELAENKPENEDLLRKLRNIEYLCYKFLLLRNSKYKACHKCQKELRKRIERLIRWRKGQLAKARIGGHGRGSGGCMFTND